MTEMCSLVKVAEVKTSQPKSHIHEYIKLELRGLGHPWTVNSLRTWCWKDMSNIVFVMGTMIHAQDLTKVQNKCSISYG